MKKRFAIITADDFGLLPDINEAVLRGYDAGLVTSAALRVGAVASSAAVVSASLRPGLSVGLHLVLCEGQATLARRHIPNLIDSSGRFPDQPLEAAWLYRKRGGLLDELKAEIGAQIERFLASGLTLSFISGHFQLHLHPSVVRIIRELAAVYPILALRKSGRALARGDRRPSISRPKAVFESRMLSLAVARGRLGTRKFVSPDRVCPHSLSRPAIESEVVANIARLPGGVTELVCHPGSMLSRYDGRGEEAVVLSATVRKAFSENNVTPISYENLIEDF